MNNSDVIRERRHTYHTWSRAYDAGASRSRDYGRWLSVTTACLSALVSSAIFTSLNAADVRPVWKIVAAGVSLTATILSAAVAALGYQETATAFRAAAVSCVALQRRAEELVARGNITEAEVAEFDAKALEVQRGLPIIVNKYYEQAQAYCDAHRNEDPFEALQDRRARVAH